jgi:O-antigen/teichoic acid export membrane protein
MRHSAPIGITYSLAPLILRCDVLILSLFVSPIAVGHFAAANMALVMVYVASWLFTSVTLPKMVQLAENADQLKAYVHRCVQYILVTTVPLCVLAFLIAQPVMRFLYGAGYSETGTLSSIMVLSVPFILLNSLYLAHAVALKAVQVYCSMYVGTAVLTLLLNGALGYLYGGQGIAVAIVIREVLMASVFTLVSRPVSLSTAAGTLGYADVDPREV